MTEDRERLLTAYGLLWLVRDDTLSDPTARVATEARRRLAGLLNDEERHRAVALGKTWAISAGIDVDLHEARAGT